MLLLTRNVRIAEIAIDLGFTSITSVNRTFKQLHQPNRRAQLSANDGDSKWMVPLGSQHHQTFSAQDNRCGQPSALGIAPNEPA
jgi:hypothetical protein